MAKVLRPITACFKKTDVMEEKNNLEENCETAEECKGQNESKICQPQPGLMWRVSSGLYNIGSGAVGLGVGSVKWAASTTYNVGSGVVSATQKVVSKVAVTGKPKPKKE